ncbi:sulfite exporter TauE/SafE family protein [Roseibacterium sp. SDUM158017]|uniref:sulfite exporter TauE/SafE family protein n=1 Tax=Roseicyclus salinarum TaxID=3036773 RepID=UPI002414E0A0|nr:sulfite exporter TauE/SafE family protein [Roseibacterium sp. SDUM158017]MDG4649279.1 sulfite exporter TauE/SafE family protein [Roseibacterium sp. SDUM158017]
MMGLETLLADPSALWALVLTLVLAGAAIGVLAGLFGVGGGAISVPVFYETFLRLGLDPDIAMPLAVGTSLAMIIPTAILSARAHAAKGALDMDQLKSWALPILAGVVVGSAVARYAPAELFQIVFVAISAIMSFRLLLANEARPIREGMGRLGNTAYGALVGFLSVLMGIGGGAISNLILTLHGWTMHRAVATSAGVGVLIAVPGTIGYVLAGWGRPGLPADALGYVSASALVLTLPTALLCTRLGVGLAHALPQKALKRLFGGFLLLVAMRFAWAILQSN